VTIDWSILFLNLLSVKDVYNFKLSPIEVRFYSLSLAMQQLENVVPIILFRVFLYL